jgi:hypothetical protein
MKIVLVKNEFNNKYIRPSDWLALPAFVENEQKLVGLVAIHNIVNKNLFSIRCSGDFKVSILNSDGSSRSATNYNSGEQALLNLSYSDYPGTECSKGYRQAIVEITPLGSPLTSVQLHERHPLGGTTAYSTNWLDMKVSGQLIQTFTLGTLSNGSVVTVPKFLEQFEWLGDSSITNFSYLFQNASALENLIGTRWTSISQTIGYMFFNCYSLTTIPLLQTSTCSSFVGTFRNCYAFRNMPLLDTSNAHDFSFMFNLAGIKEIPLIDTSKGINFTSMFRDCPYLQSIPHLNTSSGTNFSSMFNGAVSLMKIPLLNTSSGTDFSSMFNGAVSLMKIPLLNTANGQIFISMFNNCNSLKTLPALNILSVSDTGNWGTAVFANCWSLQKIDMTPFKFSLILTNCFLGRTEIVEIFNNLITTTGQNINITGNKGATFLTANDRAIATGKGWTITG